LSATLATAAGSSPSGSGTSIASANGTRRRSASAPPQSPPSGCMPYAEPRGTLRQLPVRPAVHASQPPHEIWNGTTTVSPGATAVTASPTSTTSAMHSCPSGNGSPTGTIPVRNAASRSHIATASGRTIASPSPPSAGSGTSRHSTAPTPVISSCRTSRIMTIGWSGPIERLA
jgi:hypothetical protein